jgi:hypothetical protein
MMRLSGRLLALLAFLVQAAAWVAIYLLPLIRAEGRFPAAEFAAGVILAGGCACISLWLAGKQLPRTAFQG